jgi:DNA polymerase III subunit epsilon
MRQIVLDTETTGLEPEEGHRIIEIGCIELIDRQRTDNQFHIYLNPDREIEQGAVDVHGITNEFLVDRPRFPEVADRFVAFIAGAELIIHNAPFDVGFINHEFERLPGHARLEKYCTVLDTLTLARKKHPGQRNSLDALCRRYGINNSHRDLHGALLDAEILADVYLAMTGGQTSLLLGDGGVQEMNAKNSTGNLRVSRPKIKVIYCSEDEKRAHDSRLDIIDRESGGRCLWKGL